MMINNATLFLLVGRKKFNDENYVLANKYFGIRKHLQLQVQYMFR
jgi:hypothetical protein